MKDYDYVYECKYAEAIRNMLQHETDLVMKRMNFFLLSQGFLFAAVSHTEKYSLTFVVSFIGIMSSIAFFRECRYNEIAIREILTRWDSFKDERQQNGIEIFGIPPAWAGIGETRHWIDKFIPARKSLPFIFIFGWIIINLCVWYT